MHAEVEAILHAGDEILFKEPGFVHGGASFLAVLNCFAR